MKTKNEIRRRVKAERAKLSPEWIKENSWHIQARVVALPEFKKAARICCYLPIPGEAETDMILEMCWREGKKVCVPAFRPERNCYGLAELRNGMKLVKGHFHVPEPEEPDWIDGVHLDFILVPGIGFDPSGGRVGHGKGYYDRILEGLPGVFKVGIAFECQIFDEVPMEPGDVRLEKVVTEERVLARIRGS